MNEGWIVFGACVVIVIGAALPLLRTGGDPKLPPLRKKADWKDEDEDR